MIAAVDTNILLDILLPDPDYKGSSLALLSSHMKTGSLIISEVVCGELASQFNDQQLLQDFLDDTGIRLVPSTADALWTAAKAWKKYFGTRGKELQCNACGNMALFTCPRCNSTITCRQHIIPDFLIGGHALVQSDKLLTRDRGFYRTYFTGLVTESGI